jgi:hypothetical protein
LDAGFLFETVKVMSAQTTMKPFFTASHSQGGGTDPITLAEDSIFPSWTKEMKSIERRLIAPESCRPNWELGLERYSLGLPGSARNLVLSYNHDISDASIDAMLPLNHGCWVGSIMDSGNKFAALEAMCREKAALAKKEMEYWLAEASEWKRLREATSASELRVPVQLDWCTASES